LRRMHLVERIFPVWFGLLFVPGIYAAGTDIDQKPEFGGDWVWAFFSLIVVVFLAYWATRMLAGKLGANQSPNIKVADSLCLGPNRHLYLLLVDNQVLLVGSTEHGINLLKEYSGPDFYETVRHSLAEKDQFSSGKFQDILTPLLRNNYWSGNGNLDLKTRSERLAQRLQRIKVWRRGR